MAQRTLETLVVISGRVDNSFGRIGSTLIGLGSQIDQLSQGLINFGKDSLEVYGGYEQNLLDAEGALSSQYTEASELDKVMRGLDESAQKWAATTKFHTSDVSLAISEAAHAGWDYEEMLTGIPEAMLLAQAGNLDLSEGLDYVIKSMNASKTEFSEMGAFIDQWAMAANSSATNIGEMGEAMLKMGSSMQFADSTAELFTMLGIMADMGTVGSSAGTLIRNSMMRLIAPTDKAYEAMDALGATVEEMAEMDADNEILQQANELLGGAGFSAYDNNGKLKSFLQIFRELNTVLSQMDEVDRNRILAAIFPTRTITGAINMIDALANGYDSLYEKIEDSEGYAEKVAGIQMSGISGTLAILDSQWEELKRTTGESLAPKVEGVAEALGDIVTRISQMDSDNFDLLVTGLTGIAAAGPGLIIAGGGFRLLGYCLTPAGAAALGVTALATAIGMLYEKSQQDFAGNFGDMKLDLEALEQNVDGLTTDAEESLAPLAEYVAQIDALATEYQTAMTKFSTELSTAVLTGKELSQEDKDSLLKYGADITGVVMEGIRARRDNDLTMLNQIYPDGMDEADFETYSSLFDLLLGYFDDLEADASDVGARLSGAIMEGMQDGVLDEDERAVIQEYVDMLNQIEAEIAKREDARAYNTALEKAGRISWDSFEEYMGYLAQNNEERVDAMNDYYYGLMGDTRAAMEKERGSAYTNEEWHATGEYREIEGKRSAAVSEIEGQTGELANTALGSLMRDADLYNSFEILKGLISTARRGEDGSILPGSLRFTDYLHSPEEAKAFVSDLNVLASQKGFASWLGLGENKFASMVETWKNTPGMEENYDAYHNAGQVQSELDFLLNGGDTNPWGYFANHLFGTPYYSDAAYERAFGQVETTTQAAQVEVTPHMDMSELEAAAQEGYTVPVTPEVEPGGLTGALADMGVEPVEMESTVTGAAEAGSTAHSEAQTALSAQGALEATVSIPNAYSAASSARSAMQSTFNTPLTQYVNIVSRGSTTAGLTKYAEGGRADEPSIFGDAGAEWAIPEEHSVNTARLLDEARAASGFTWPELIASAGDGGGWRGGSGSTFIYGPTIIAQDARGVEQALIEDKARLEQWWRERELRERIEVYR